MVMREELLQGNILKIEHIKHPVLIVSKDFFNKSGEIIGCPIFRDSTKSPLHICISSDEVNGYVQCEKLALLDLRLRGYKKIGRIRTENIMDISDAIQGIFEYI